MTNDTQRMRANRVFEGRTCGWCSRPLVLGEEIVVCGSCQAAHHTACWDEKLGCATGSCLNAPLKELPTTAREGLCGQCGAQRMEGAAFCAQCGFALDPGGAVVPGPAAPAPRVESNLAAAIMVTAFCCIPFGIVGIVYAAQVKGRLANGDYAGARELAKKARNWTLAGFLTGGVFVILYVILVGFSSQLP